MIRGTLAKESCVSIEIEDLIVRTYLSATGVTVKRQLLSQTRPLGPASRDGSPQTVAQVVIAPPPQQSAPEEQHHSAPPSLPQTPAQSEEVPQRQPSPSHTS